MHFHIFELNKVGAKHQHFGSAFDLFTYDKDYMLKINIAFGDIDYDDDGNPQYSYSNDTDRVINEYFAVECYKIFGLHSINFILLYNTDYKQFPQLMLLFKKTPELRPVECIFSCKTENSFFRGFFIDCILLNGNIYKEGGIYKDQYGTFVRADCSNTLCYNGLKHKNIIHETFIKHNTVFKFLHYKDLLDATALLNEYSNDYILNMLEKLRLGIENCLLEKFNVKIVSKLQKMVFDRFMYYKKNTPEIIKNLAETFYKKFIIQKCSVLPDSLLYFIMIWSIDSDSVSQYKLNEKTRMRPGEYSVSKTYGLKTMFQHESTRPTNLIRHVEFICKDDCDAFFESFRNLNQNTHTNIVRGLEYLPDGLKRRSPENIINNFMNQFRVLSKCFYIQAGTTLYRGIVSNQLPRDIVERLNNQFNATTLVLQKAYHVADFSMDTPSEKVIIIELYLESDVDCIPVFIAEIEDEYEVILPPYLNYKLTSFDPAFIKVNVTMNFP